MPQPIDDEALLVAQGITKSFSGNVALSDFDLELRAGEVHALVGHNGSGKSTFVKILAGFYVPDSGELSVRGVPLRFGDPQGATAAGLSFVHQTLGLVPSLSVLENLHLGKPYRVRGLWTIDWRRERREAAKRLADFGLDVDPRTLVSHLTTIERVEVAIVRAITGAETITTLVLDEPTAALTEHEVSRLFEIVRRAKARGVSVIYISHRLEELPLIADSATVLRDGRIVARGPMSEFGGGRLVQLIAGSEAARAPRAALEPVPADAREVLRLEGLSGSVLDGVDIRGRAGEILGVVGLLGSGVEELVAILGGRAPARAGAMALDGKSAPLGDLAALSRLGFDVVIGDKSERVVGDLDLAENATLQVVRRFFRGGRLRLSAMRRRARQILADFKVSPPIPSLPAGRLSGGNQQKLAVARVLQAEPKALLLEEPFHGVDVRGRQEITAILDGARRDGRFVLVVDSDLDEIVNICDTILVLREGRIVLVAEGEHKNKQRLLEACYGEMEVSR